MAFIYSRPEIRQDATVATRLRQYRLEHAPRRTHVVARLMNVTRLVEQWSPRAPAEAGSDFHFVSGPVDTTRTRASTIYLHWLATDKLYLAGNIRHVNRHQLAALTDGLMMVCHYVPCHWLRLWFIIYYPLKTWIRHSIRLFPWRAFMIYYILTTVKILTGTNVHIEIYPCIMTSGYIHPW